MMMTRWVPRRSSMTPWNDVDRWLNDVFRGWEDDGHTASCGVSPSADVYETEDGFTVEAELPGLKADDIKVEVSDNVLTISGEKSAENKEKTQGYSRTERSYGSFCRSFRLPTSVDEKKISADYESVVLKVSLPKKEDVKPKLIEVKKG